MKALKLDTAPEPDVITPEFYKVFGEILSILLTGNV